MNLPTRRDLIGGFLPLLIAASGGMAAIWPAIFKASAITSASGTTRLTKPITCASWAEIGRPVSKIRIALNLPTARTRR